MVVLLPRLACERDGLDALQNAWQASPADRLVHPVLGVSAGRCVGLEFHQVDVSSILGEQGVVDLYRLVRRLVGPDDVPLDGQLRDDLPLKLGAGELLHHAFEVRREEDVGAAFQLVRGEVTPAFEVAEDGLQRVSVHCIMPHNYYLLSASLSTSSERSSSSSVMQEITFGSTGSVIAQARLPLVPAVLNRPVSKNRFRCFLTKFFGI